MVSIAKVDFALVLVGAAVVGMAFLFLLQQMRHGWHTRQNRLQFEHQQYMNQMREEIRAEVRAALGVNEGEEEDQPQGQPQDQ